MESIYIVFGNDGLDFRLFSDESGAMEYAVEASKEDIEGVFRVERHWVDTDDDFEIVATVIAEAWQGGEEEC